jgi:hypothetical protein
VNAISVHQTLTLLAWFLFAALAGLLLVIARFFGRQSGKPMYYAVFAAPIILFGAASARGAFLNQVGGDSFSDVLWATGGVLLAGLSVHLYVRMTRSQ